MKSVELLVAHLENICDLTVNGAVVCMGKASEKGTGNYCNCACKKKLNDIH
jgi:hypothetical protein